MCRRAIAQNHATTRDARSIKRLDGLRIWEKIRPFLTHNIFEFGETAVAFAQQQFKGFVFWGNSQEIVAIKAHFRAEPFEYPMVEIVIKDLIVPNYSSAGATGVKRMRPA